MPRAGNEAKVAMVASSAFDPDDLIRIAWSLGHEAGRLGLRSLMPRLEPPVVQQPMASAG